jgi:hypothetical protein
VFPRSARLRLRVDVPHQLTGPLPAQAVVGTAVVLDGSRAIARIPVLLPRRLSPVSGVAIATRFVTRPLALLVITAGVCASGLLARSARRRRRMDPGGKLEAA